MKTDLHAILNIKNYFIVLKSTENYIKFTLGEPSRILLKNIYINWLKFLYAKTCKHMPVYINRSTEFNNKELPYGIINGGIPKYNKDTEWVHRLSEFGPENKSQLQLKIMIPQGDMMQHFIQWQRYRKYWWSSISTTPSLFNLNDIKHEEESGSHVDVVANFTCGPRPVETIRVNKYQNNTSSLTCTMSLESALFVLLMDGLNNRSKEEYLRLHRKMAPYKISFALDTKDEEHKKTLSELASVLYDKLQSKSIVAWQPDFTLPLAAQIKESLHMGVTYTAILNGTTLENGIFHLLNSSTMLKEQIHVADFHTYAALLFSDK